MSETDPQPIEHDSSITEALASLTQCLPPATETTPFTAQPSSTDNGAAPPPEHDPFAPSTGLTSVTADGLLDGGKSESLNGILCSLSAAIEPTKPPSTQPLSQPSSHPHSRPASPLGTQHHDDPLEGMGAQLLELQHHLAAPKPRSKAAALAEAIQKVQDADEAKAAAAAAAAAAKAGVVEPPAPDFTLLSEEVEQTLHRRHADDHHKKHHTDSHKHQARPPASNQHRGASSVPVPPAGPSAPPVRSNAPSAPFPPPPPTQNAAISVSNRPPPGFVVPPGGSRVHPQARPHSFLREVGFQPPEPHGARPHVGLRDVGLQPPMLPAPPNIRPVTIIRPHPSFGMVENPGFGRRVELPATGMDHPAPGAGGEQASQFPRSHEQLPGTTAASENAGRGVRGKPESRWGRDKQPDRPGAGSRGHTQDHVDGWKVGKSGSNSQRNANQNKGTAASNTAGSNGARPVVHSSNPLKRVPEAPMSPTGGQSVPDSHHRPADGAHALLSKDKSQSKSSVADGKDRGGPGGHKIVREDPGMKSNRPGGGSAPSSGEKTDGQHNAKPIATGQVPSAAGMSLAERRAMLQGKIRKSGAGGMGQGGSTASTGVARDSAAAEREARIRAEKAALQQENARKREAAAAKQQALAERAERAAKQKQQALAERAEQAAVQKTQADAERAARQKQQVAEKAVLQNQRDPGHRKDKKRRRKAEEEDSEHRGAGKAARNGLNSTGGVPQDPGKPMRPPPASAREGSFPKPGSQRHGRKSSKDGGSRADSDPSDEDEGEPHDVRRKHEPRAPVAKSNRVAFASRVTRLDSSSEDEWEAAAPSRCAASDASPNELSAYASVEQSSGKRGNAPPANGAARDTAPGPPTQNTRRDTKPSGTDGGLGRWGSDVEKFVADRAAYLGHEPDTRSPKLQNSVVARTARESSQPSARAAAARMSDHTATASARSVTIRAAGADTPGAHGGVGAHRTTQRSDVQRNVAMHDVEAQTEDADVRCSAVQTPSVWGRSSQCQTDVAGVHDALRVGAPVTVDTSCGPSSGDLQNVPEASDRGRSMHEDATAATRALEAIERMLTHAPHAQRKQLQHHCWSLGHLIAEVSGTAARQVHGDHVSAPNERAQPGGDDGNAAMLLQLSPRSLAAEPAGANSSGPVDDPDAGAAELHAARHDSRVNEPVQQNHTSSAGAASGDNEQSPLRSDQQERSKDTDADMHDVHASGGSELDLPSEDFDGLQGPDAASEGHSEGDVDEDMQGVMEEVFGVADPETHEDVHVSIEASHDASHAAGRCSDDGHAPMHAEAGQGEHEQERPAASVGEPARVEHRSPPRPHSRATGSVHAAGGASHPYSSVLAHEEVSDDEMLLEVSPGAQWGASVSDASLEERVHAPGKRCDEEKLPQTVPRVHHSNRPGGEGRWQGASAPHSTDSAEAPQTNRQPRWQNAREAQHREHADAEQADLEKEKQRRRKRSAAEESGARDASRAGGKQGSDRDQAGTPREARRDSNPEPLDAVLKAQILGKLSKMLPKANLEVATAKRIIKKLELDLRVDVKSHSDFVKHWIDEYLSDPTALSNAAAAATAEAAAQAEAGTGAGGDADGVAGRTHAAPGAASNGAAVTHNSSGGQATFGWSVAIDVGGRKGPVSSARGVRDYETDGLPGSRPGTPSSSAPLGVARAGYDSPAVSTGTPPGSPTRAGRSSSGQGLASRMNGPGPSMARQRGSDTGIYVPQRKTAKDRFRSTMTAEQLADAKAAAAAALG